VFLIKHNKKVVPNLWYAYPWGGGVSENNIGNGEGKPKELVQIKTQKQNSEVLVYKEIFM
jgi:hypothetical protein